MLPRNIEYVHTSIQRPSYPPQQIKQFDSNMGPSRVPHIIWIGYKHRVDFLRFAEHFLSEHTRERDYIYFPTNHVIHDFLVILSILSLPLLTYPHREYSDESCHSHTAMVSPISGPYGDPAALHVDDFPKHRVRRRTGPSSGKSGVLVRCGMISNYQSSAGLETGKTVGCFRFTESDSGFPVSSAFAGVGCIKRNEALSMSHQRGGGGGPFRPSFPQNVRPC